MPVGNYSYQFFICCPRDCVSRHNGGTSGAPVKPLRVDSALRCFNSPHHDDEEVQSVPALCQVSSFAHETHRDHFYDHLQREECEDQVVKNLSKTQLYYAFIIRNNLLFHKNLSRVGIRPSKNL